MQKLGRRLCEVPAGFKWSAPGLFEGSLCFDGEESAGASFLRQDGIVWTTDKDGPIMDLLAAEITARTGKDPGKHFTGTGGGIPYTLLHAHRCAGDTPTERKAREAFAGGRQGIKACRRDYFCKADPCSWQRRTN
jgi:hypothetical protein